MSINKIKNKTCQSYLEINLDNIANNYSTIRSFIDKKVIIAAVLKADAYGLGISKVAKTLYEKGCKHFFVSTIEEGISIKKTIGKNSDLFVYILNGYFESKMYLQYNLIPVINSINELQMFRKNNYKNKLTSVIKIDTGLSRRGLLLDEVKNYINEIKSIKPKLIVSHLICHNDDNINEKQLEKFIKIKNILGNEYKYSLAATNGIFLNKKYHFDMIRVGAGLYGLVENEEYKNKFLKVFSLKVKILQIKNISKGSIIGYNCQYIAKKDLLVAILAIGYAEGLNQNVQYFANINNKKYNFIGEIYMNYSTIDITEINIRNINIGDYVEIECNINNYFQLLTNVKSKKIYLPQTEMDIKSTLV